MRLILEGQQDALLDALGAFGLDLIGWLVRAEAPNHRGDYMYCAVGRIGKRACKHACSGEEHEELKCYLLCGLSLQER